MSILNQASDGLFNVLIAVYKLVLQEGALPQSKMFALCAPPTVADEDAEKMVRQTVNRWVELNLFERLEPDNTIRLAEGLPPETRDPKTGLARLPHTLRGLVLAEENNPDLWATEEARSADFSRALSWVLAQDPFAMSEKGWDEVDDLQSIQGFKSQQGTGIIQNNTRWTGFCAWANFLGFGWYPSNKFMPDPAEAIHAVLPSLFAEKAEFNQDEFCAELGRCLPVLDGGRFRQMVEDKIAPDMWAPPGEGRLSLSLSLALQRLRLAHVLEFFDRADSPRGRIVMTGMHGRRSETFTHVRFLGVNS